VPLTAGEVRIAFISADPRIDLSGRTALVAGAGPGILRPTSEQVLDDWKQVMDVKLKGALLISRAATRVMAPRHSGTLLKIASIAGSTAWRAANVFGGARDASVARPACP
jgi:NADP-dependent 3-hydroxy acid dehydrogenase YdfG